ncbi:MAG: hypothetical protein A2289_23460 [Deltaproteobacteria bacterium RIFOXYA12_FULL_58_15]|nr:MAG: hypothetical protein A2289_23460 [Deltaproteobacteria bacterium RIFOXYA12_FULL_58_15]OGR14679.1 MAG: hypothetical protein A2341_06520 [Deltaproteobacteria bacterium RIFOXYB12_FULL_58_9]
MALNIKNKFVEQLAADIANQTGETKTTAIRRALEERKARLGLHQPAPRREKHLRAFLQREIWPEFVGQPVITKEERERILGYGEDGV